MSKPVIIDIGIPIDLEQLLKTRLLIQAMSGGGKSYVIRKLCEVAAGRTQIILLDPEGEFVTLREKFPFALVATDGEIPLSLKYAETLATKLLETGLSAIIDLYELKAYERLLFVKRFLDSLNNAKKALWHSVLVIIDEAHVFCPEGSKSESAGAVIDLCTRGRKKGFAAVLATQRISKLHKDAAAECGNKLIGRTGLDLDRKRAAEELGFTAKADTLALRNLAPGEFHAYGPAISPEVVRFRVTTVATTHLEAGARAAPPPTPGAIKKILEKLQDLPQEAQRDLETKEQLQAEVARLSRILKSKGAGASDPAAARELEQIRVELVKELAAAKERINRQELELNEWEEFLGKIRGILEEQLAKVPLRLENGTRLRTTPIVIPAAPAGSSAPGARPAAAKAPAPRAARQDPPPAAGTRKLQRCPLAVLRFLASFPDRTWSKAQVGVATGYAPGSGNFGNALSELAGLGLIRRDGGRLQVIEDPTLQEYLGAGFTPQAYGIDTFMDRLSKCEREVYQVLLEHPRETFSKEQIAALTPSQYAAGSGNFGNALGRLNTLELITRDRGLVRLNPELLEIVGI